MADEAAISGSAGEREQADLLESFGYKQELARDMGRFSSFAASFSGVSITTSMFLLLPFLLTQAGSAGLWTWILSSVGVFLVALVFADLVGRIPVSGYAYQWSSRLSNARFGWFVATAGLIGFGVGCAGTIYGVTPFFLDEFGISVTTTSNIVGAIVMTALVTVVNINGIKLVERLNNAAVVTELASSLVVGVALLIYAVIEHPHPASYLFHQQTGAHGAYFGSFILAFLVGAFTYAAWELPADLAEETQDAPNVAARTMLTSIAAVSVAGLVLLVSYIYASPNLATTASDSVPVLSILQYQWGSTAKDIINVLFLVGFLATSMMIMTGAARLLFSLARDNMAPFSPQFRRVSKRHNVPHVAIIGVAIFSVLMFSIPALISSSALSYVLGTASVGYNLVYLLVACLFIVKARRGTLPRSFGRFSLGRWAEPVGWAAALWQLFLIGTLTLPKINQKVGLTTLGMFAVTLVWYLLHVRPKTATGEAGPPGGGIELPSAGIPDAAAIAEPAEI
jgi:amino acid transporter